MTTTESAPHGAHMRDARPAGFVGVALSAGALWLGGALLLALGASLTCPKGVCGAGAFDAALFEAARAMRTVWLDVLMGWGTWLGSLALLLPLAAGLAWHHARLNQWPRAIFLLASLGGATLAAHLCKWLVARPRPDWVPLFGAMPQDFSFPSAHTMQITAIALALALGVKTQYRWHALAAAALVITLVGFSRVYLHVHYPTDVVFGCVAAAAWVSGLWLVMRRT